MKKICFYTAVPISAFIFLLSIFGLTGCSFAQRPADNQPQEAVEATGPPSQESPSTNLALNPGQNDYPNPLESDHGWGGGADKWDIVDGERNYEDWRQGLAFTGGLKPYHEAAGWRQATIDFGVPKTFNRVTVWHHGLENVPNTYKIQYWDGRKWVDITETASGHDYLKYPANPAQNWYEDWSTPTENEFEPVTGSKVRFLLENSDIVHGWIYQFEVYYDIR